jgi:hypothetical protein
LKRSAGREDLFDGWLEDYLSGLPEPCSTGIYVEPIVRRYLMKMPLEVQHSTAYTHSKVRRAMTEAETGSLARGSIKRRRPEDAFHPRRVYVRLDHDSLCLRVGKAVLKIQEDKTHSPLERQA